MMPSQRSSTLAAFLVACLGIALFSIMDGVMKALVIAIGAYNAMLWRQIVGFGLGGDEHLLRRSPPLELGCRVFDRAHEDVDRLG
jgi:S-adenosylmethionine uptake transporter